MKKKLKINPEIKRYLVSSGITFTSAFLMVFGTQLDISVLDESVLFALFITAIRAGVKAVSEHLSGEL